MEADTHRTRTSGRLRSARSRLGYLAQALGIIRAAVPGLAVAWLMLLLLQGLLPASVVYLTKLLVDRVAWAAGEGGSVAAIQRIAWPAVLIGTALLAEQGIQGAVGWVRAILSERVVDHVKGLIHEKAASVDLEFFETPAYVDRMARASSEAAPRVLSILQHGGNLLQHLATLAAVALLLLPYGAALPLILVLSTVPALWIVVHHHRLHHAWWEQTTEDRRWIEYFDRVLVHPSLAPEVRLFGLTGHFRSGYVALRCVIRGGYLRLIRNQQAAQVGISALALAATGAVMGWMGLRVLRGAATLGDLALFYQAFQKGQSLVRSLLNSVGQLYADALFLEHLFTFLALPASVRAPVRPRPVPGVLRRGIEVRGVSFRYPGSDTLALKDFDLFIPAGRTVAIVGANGAGKSTLVKLLCRFYDPEVGSVTWDGVDLREMSPARLRQRITVLFQQYVNYAGSVAENVAMGDVSVPLDADRVRAAARAGGAEGIIEHLPHGYETRLGKQFRGGVDLSGGQWQRLALARAFYREAPFVILDEPTSFMDSWAEVRWLDRFRSLVEGRTAVVVTHRFTTAMRADVIHVMHAGRIVESGTHEELLQQGGRYALSWRAQMQAGATHEMSVDRTPG